MNIEIDEDEYKTLLEYFYIGNIIACYENEEFDDKSIVLYDKVLEVGYKNNRKEVVYNLMYKSYSISEEEKQILDKKINEKINKMTLVSLCEILARRDLLKKYGQEQLDKMDGSEYFSINESIMEMYRTEFENNEFDNMIIENGKSNS